MIRTFSRFLTKLRRDESGTSTVEFVLIVPVYFFLLLISVEIGLITLRHALLERGLDIAVREVRLSTTNVPEYTEIRKLVCDNSLFIADCEANLRLEMVRTDIRAFNEMSDTVQCENAAEPTNPDDIVFDNSGLPNQLMQIRACYRYQPLFPAGALGQALKKDADGRAAIVSMSAFVQEPL